MAVQANQNPIITETILGGDSLDIIDNPMGDKQSSPIV
jgi:hypothetical protein